LGAGALKAEAVVAGAFVTPSVTLVATSVVAPVLLLSGAAVVKTGDAVVPAGAGVLSNAALISSHSDLLTLLIVIVIVMFNVFKAGVVGGTGGDSVAAVEASVKDEIQDQADDLWVFRYHFIVNRVSVAAFWVALHPLGKRQGEESHPQGIEIRVEGGNLRVNI
jgi:hypothetical protein